MKKKLIIILLSLSIPFSMISCKNNTNNVTNEGNNNSTISDNSTTSQAEEKEEEKHEDLDENKEKNAKIYYYDVVSDKIVYINSIIEVDEDQSVNALINELKKSPNTDIEPALSSDITLNSYTIDNENSIITLDFSSNFVSSQNLGAGAESSTLAAICNTFGSYFNVENVIITLDGQPYSSGHILMTEGETFKVDLNNAVELVMYHQLSWWLD